MSGSATRQGDGLLPQLGAGGVHRRADAGHDHRAALLRRLRHSRSRRARSAPAPAGAQASAATWVIAVDVPGPISVAALRTVAMPSASMRTSARGGQGVGGIGRRRHAQPDQHVAVPHRPRLGRPPRPAEQLGARARSTPQRLARPGPVVLRVARPRHCAAAARSGPSPGRSASSSIAHSSAKSVSDSPGQRM